MNGRPHALIGAAVPLGALVAGTPVAQVATLSALAAGAAMMPDLDHPNSTASRAWSKPVHLAVHAASTMARKGLSTSLDLRDSAWRKMNGRDPEHRALTHTAVAACMAGLVAAALGSGAVGVPLMVIGSGWTLRRLASTRSKLLLMALFGAVAALAVFFPVSAVSAGLAVGGGWLSHVVADGCTRDGVPLAWPVTIRGKHWYRVRILGSTLTSGQDAEYLAALVIASLFAITSAFVPL